VVAVAILEVLAVQAVLVVAVRESTIMVVLVRQAKETTAAQVVHSMAMLVVAAAALTMQAQMLVLTRLSAEMAVMANPQQLVEQVLRVRAVVAVSVDKAMAMAALGAAVLAVAPITALQTLAVEVAGMISPVVRAVPAS
jgi:hypothetical protein